MMDRLTVMGCLEGLTQDDWERWYSDSEVQETAKAALALLKEQEPVEPIFKLTDDKIFVWTCGSCGAYMYHIYNGIDNAKEYAKYCRQCGRPVKWG